VPCPAEDSLPISLHKGTWKKGDSQMPQPIRFSNQDDWRTYQMEYQLPQLPSENDTASLENIKH